MLIKTYAYSPKAEICSKNRQTYKQNVLWKGNYAAVFQLVTFIMTRRREQSCSQPHIVAHESGVARD